MGAFALDLGWKRFTIHGTNRPYGVGKRSSHGCIRLYPEDIAQLFVAVPIGTDVTIMDVPYKIGRLGKAILLEITPTQEQSDIIAEYGEAAPLSIPEIYGAIYHYAGDDAEIFWRRVEDAIAYRNGIPVVIGEMP